jgi:uncharacterized ion transporter superfamily protein YfcC
MKFRTFPNAFAIVVGFILLAGVLTYLVPKGQYDRTIDPETKREVVVPGSFRFIEESNLTPFEILLCVPRGMVNAGEVMVLIFMVGGCLFIVEKTGALKEGVVFFSARMKGREESALVLMGLLFAIGGATEGLEEEIIPLIPVLLVFTRTLGYTPLVTVGGSFGSAMVGAAFSPINPFGAVIAQKIAEVPFLTNSAFRLVVFCFAFALWMVVLIRYANKNRIEKEYQDQLVPVTFSRAHTTILLLVAFAFSLLIYGMLNWGWGFNEISAEFFAVGILVGLIGGLGFDGTFLTYTEGLKQMTFAAMVGGLAYGIPLVLKEGAVIDTIIYGLFTPLQYIPSILSLLGMMGTQAMLHIFVPSYSGQAVLTMPILAPLTDLIGISRDLCVMAFQYGAVLMNMISPTNGALMAILTIAGISYEKWVGFILKRLLLLYLFCALAIFIKLSIDVAL